MKVAITMKALQLRELGKLDEVELPVPAPKADEVLIRTLATTVCTSDLMDIDHNPFGIRLPRVLGHESAGVIASVGETVTGFRKGQRVAVHPVIPCGACASCRRNLGHLCDRMGHLGYDRDGAYAEYFCVRADRVREPPQSLDIAVSTLLEPLAVCIEAVRRTRISEGDRILVVGDGPFGILITRLALRLKPNRMILVGREDFRLRQAAGAVCIHAGRTIDLRSAVLEAAGGEGVDAAILAVANIEALDLCVQSLRPRGRLGIFAALAPPAPIDLMRIHVKELDVLGICNDENCIDEALAGLADPSLSLGSIITHRVPFREWRKALDLAANHKHQALKVTMLFGEP